MREPNRFILLLDSLSTDNQSKAIDDKVKAIQANCLAETGDKQAASDLRMDLIRKGAGNAAFYNDEAQYLLKRYAAEDDPGLIDKALEILDLAEKNGVADDFTRAIKANCLAQSGDKQAASDLRMDLIRKGAGNAAFYADEAQYLLKRYAAEDDPGLIDKALEILDLAEKNGVADDFTRAIKANCLAQSGDKKAASDLRMGLIRKGAGNAAFYNDEAQYLLKRYAAEDDPGLIDKALEILDLAEKNGAANDFTRAIKDKCSNYK